MHGWAKTIAVSLSLMSLTFALGACEIGGGGGEGDLFERIPGNDDDILDTLGIVCEDILHVTGTYTATTPQPADKTGCWDVGIWSVTNIEIEVAGCAPSPTFLDSYTYEAQRNDEDQVNTEIIYTDDPSFDRLNLKISTAGDGLCHGSFAHFYTDNTVLEISPTLLADGTLEGDGTFAYHLEDPY